ncbi:BadF/BadG/BcrA/BcrD ATPase family protein [Streptomyces sp. H10-C2]|uniref:N-acetylglucosamine kinase n=1 Tax=unclassified Streptomyces TaxID=2593676 RepID=UPI0024B8EFD4|nr:MULTISPECIES: BadF/BadG/BcrA/BcrD ATPase family protein [unclassified Streptomyces]MDJ0340085.1 BadF/BadG/BcrA/BcrD ATPase family protein [Streptomyces sp. PH10-H1]MDJ0369278.1 BadF/BadG/BcrA/BcrD ATPase family protein [Streptomyces sp. H10-C2]
MGLNEPLVPGGVLAIDAGNSKTDVAIVAADGTVLGTARGGGFQPPVVGIGAAVAVVAGIVARAAAAAGLAFGEGPLTEHTSACLANADLPVEEQELELAVHAKGWSLSTRVANDTFAILRAGVDEPRGVAVVCGAGINCVGMLPDGRTARFPAIGKISGDWGGGSGLAEEALWYAARAEDGRGGPTELAATLPAHYGLTSMYALIEALHLEHIAPSRKYELTPVLFSTADAGDPVARRIVRRQADEIVALAAVALGRLDLLDEEADVVLGGGVLAAGNPALMDAISEGLAVRAPKAVTRVVSAAPVLGAALLGLDHLAAEPAVHTRLRAHYTRA